MNMIIESNPDQNSNHDKSKDTYSLALQPLNSKPQLITWDDLLGRK